MNLLRRWLGAPGAADMGVGRWVVVDVETTGLDLQRDHLLAIAAVALQIDADRRPRILLGDSFEATLRHEGAVADKDNILLHGIGVGEQRAGAPAATVLDAFERWLAGAPLLAFHAAFDRTMIARAMKASLGRTLRNPWLDLEPVAAALHPDVGGRTLDDWLAHFGIHCAPRHQAAADTLATADLTLRLWPAARAQGCASLAGLRRLARQRHRLAAR